MSHTRPLYVRRNLDKRVICHDRPLYVPKYLEQKPKCHKRPLFVKRDIDKRGIMMSLERPLFVKGLKIDIHTSNEIRVCKKRPRREAHML